MEIQYSLLAALVDEKKANLFDDIVLHIIEYVVSLIAEDPSFSAKYHTTSSLQDKITDIVGIEIPITIIRNAVSLVSRKSDDIAIRIVGDKGNQFTIQRAWDASRTSSVLLKSQGLLDRKCILEKCFAEYINENGYESGVGIEDFLLANQRESMLYMQGELPSSLNGDFIAVANFIKETKEREPNLYATICDITWGASIAGLLSDSNMKFKRKKQRKATAYYLDTPIIMAALDLSRESSVSQVHDLLKTIHSNENIAYAHPLTVQEVEQILDSVVRNGDPLPSSELYEAWIRRNLRASDLARIKSNLKELLEEQGITVLDIVKSQLQRMQDEHSERLARLLSTDRTGVADYSFRETHDICLWEYVSQKNGAIEEFCSIEAYFVTSNTDLVRFSKKHQSQKRKNCLIRLNDVVLNQWLHGGLSSNLEEELLSARMATCFVANDIDTKQRMTAILNYFEKGSPMTEEEASILYTALVHRPSRLLKEVDNLANLDEHDLEVTKSNLLCIAKERTKEFESRHEHYKKQLEDATTVKQLLRQQKEIREKIAEYEKQRDCRIEFIEQHISISPWYIFIILKILGISLFIILLYFYWDWIWYQIKSHPWDALVVIFIPSFLTFLCYVMYPDKIKQLWNNLQIEFLSTYKKRTIQDKLKKDSLYQELKEKLANLKESDEKIETQLQPTFKIEEPPQNIFI